MPILTDSALNMELPKMIKVKQIFDNTEIKNVEATIFEQLNRIRINSTVKPGCKVAVAVGSRGIGNLDIIVRTVGKCLKSLGAKPFIVPAMGSHGGATSKGQKEVLKGYGIDESSMEMPIKSSMEVIKLGKTKDGVPVFMDKLAYNADMVVPIARIKPHTDFKGVIESGLCKMLAIGLGKHEGCSRLHQEGFERFDTIIPEVAKVFLCRAPVGFGIAIVENAYDRTALIRAVPAGDFLKDEPELLKLAKKLMPCIMLPSIDVLIVEQLGKDISGAGMDPNIIGRTTKGPLEGFNGPEIKRIVVSGLSKASHGNACGIGLADFTTKKAVNGIDYVSTYANVIASGNPEAGRIPVVMDNERESVIAAIKCCPQIDQDSPKIVRIKDTLHLEHIFLSENMITDIFDNKSMQIID